MTFLEGEAAILSNSANMRTCKISGGRPRMYGGVDYTSYISALWHTCRQTSGSAIEA
jgi:hypothetical protein